MGSKGEASENRLAIGLGLGLSLGAAFGLLMDNLAMGISLGLVFGVCYGVIDWGGGDDEKDGEDTTPREPS